MDNEEYLDRVRAALARSLERGGEDPLASKEAGLLEYGPCVDAFCATVGMDPAVQPDSERIAWARQLRRIAEKWKVAPDVLRVVVQHKEGSEFGWKVWNSPYQAERDLGAMIGQHLSNGIRQRDGGGNAEIRARWAAGEVI